MELNPMLVFDRIGHLLGGYPYVWRLEAFVLRLLGTVLATSEAMEVVGQGFHKEGLNQKEVRAVRAKIKNLSP